jgi:transglutaminase superfamily protein
MISTSLAAPELVAERDSNVPVPSVARCMLMLFALKLALGTAGFDRTIRWIRRRVESVSTGLAPGAGEIAAVEHSVAMAGALYPGRALCLEQSLVLYYVLRRSGLSVEYCQGVQAHPFLAHAWVEHRGEPINDVPEHVKHFVILPAQLP